MKKAIYAFSGDPITFGHLDIIERAARVFDKLIVGIGVNPVKKYLMSLEERAELAKTATAHIPNVEVIYFRGLLVDYAYENNIPTIIRGLRNNEDFSFELMLHQIGESQKMYIDTFFIPSKQDLTHISSGAVKAIQLEQGMIHEYVPLIVKQKLEERLSGQYIIGVTGEIGSGKSFVCKTIQELGQVAGIEVHIVDIDHLGHEILEKLQEPLFKTLREAIAKEFGETLLTDEGFIDTKALGKIVFSDITKLNHLNKLLYKPLLLRLRKAIYGKKGIILLDSALITESGMSYLCNNNVILIKTNKDDQLKRLKERRYTQAQIDGRLNSQYNYEAKRTYLEKEIYDKNHGKITYLDNVEDNSSESIKKLTDILFNAFKPEKLLR
ncbi:pantetheine-phosphate adenylyltransferase [Sporocytophaga myxococcoides]|uniref:pantetheine-phosphate adenylyltransferase n=1 Tax=Sporocytophaga myxococcoides TaxID=153721 RepID=UPI0004263F42|nr:pantetheine-phosphate adenylyltransferase [Sporocytophaga myxococcoides]